MRYIFLAAVVFLFIAEKAQSQQNGNILGYLEGASVSEGEEIFVGKCSKCHQVCDQELGPPLADIMYKRPFPWLLSFIRNSSEVIESGDEYAVYLYNSYNKVPMPDFSELSEGDIANVLAYLKRESDKNRKDTVIEQQAADAPGLIEKARKNPFGVEKKDFYSINSEHEIPVDASSVVNGRQLFNQFCSRCHEVCRSDIGPALAGITKRLPLSWLLAFMDDPKEVIKTGDHYSNFLVSNYDFIMPGFNYLSADQKLDILAFIRKESAAAVSSSGANSKMLSEQNELDTTIEVTKEKESIEDQVKTAPEADSEMLKLLFVPLILIVFGFLAFVIVRYFRK